MVTKTYKCERGSLVMDDAVTSAAPSTQLLSIGDAIKALKLYELGLSTFFLRGMKDRKTYVVFTFPATPADLRLL